MPYYQPSAPQPGSGFSAFNYTGGVRDPGNAAMQTVDPTTMTVGGQLTGLLASDSPYIKQAIAQSQAQAASRGLLNSSMAAGSGVNAAIASALPIAQGNAQEYASVSAANQQAQNQLVGENLAYEGQVDAAGAMAGAQEFGAQLNYNAQMAAQKMNYQIAGQQLGFNYAQLSQQGTQFTQQLAQNNQQFGATLNNQQQEFQQTQAQQIGMYQGNMSWQQYQTGLQMQMNSQNAYAQEFSAIMNNPNMTAQDRASALTSAQQFYSGMAQQNAAIPMWVPPWTASPSYWSSNWSFPGMPSQPAASAPVNYQSAPTYP